MENYTQLGLAGLTLGILFFVVKYFVQSMNKKDDHIERLNGKFIELVEKDIKSRDNLTKAIYEGLIKK